ncbi:MAG: RND transporter, partial [Eubacteriales bacterium]|nr:RND transporter [Eubacteriales bacterium]
KVKAIVSSSHDALVIPRNVILTDGNRRFVQVLEDGVKAERDIKLGLETSTQAEVLEGLSEGELVIVH